MSTRRRTGFSRVELLAAAASGFVLFTSTAAMIGDGVAGGHGARSSAFSIKDGTQAVQIHKAMIIFANEFKDRYPRPGLIDRLPVDTGNGPVEIPGRGEEDVTQNTTAAFYSIFVMNNYFRPDLAISPIERNPKVEFMTAYDFKTYDVVKDAFWDPSFAADLEKRSNASYAHLPMFGKRAEREWRTTLNARYPVLGNRGPLGGERDVKSFTCGPHGHWAGKLVFNDNHTELLTSMTASKVQFVKDNAKVLDNFFAMETGPGGEDVIISFTKEMTKQGPTLQHD